MIELSPIKVDAESLADQLDELAEEYARLERTVEHWRHEVGKRESQIARLQEENQRLRAHICQINNVDRHEWAQAVDDATQKLFRKLNAGIVCRPALAAAEGEAS